MNNFLEIISKIFSGVFSVLQWIALIISGILLFGIIFLIKHLISFRQEKKRLRKF